MDGYKNSFDKLWGYANVIRFVRHHPLCPPAVHPFSSPSHPPPKPRNLSCCGQGTEHLSEEGCIVLVSGTPAKRAKPGQISLASVGASVEHLTKSLAAELAPRRICCVSPGLVGTPMHTDGSAEREAALAKMTSGKPLISVENRRSRSQRPQLKRVLDCRESYQARGHGGGAGGRDHAVRDQRLHDGHHHRRRRRRARADLSRLLESRAGSGCGGAVGTGAPAQVEKCSFTPTILVPPSHPS